MSHRQHHSQRQQQQQCSQQDLIRTTQHRQMFLNSTQLMLNNVKDYFDFYMNNFVGQKKDNKALQLLKFKNMNCCQLTIAYKMACEARYENNDKDSIDIGMDMATKFQENLKTEIEQKYSNNIPNLIEIPLKAIINNVLLALQNKRIVEVKAPKVQDFTEQVASDAISKYVGATGVISDKNANIAENVNTYYVNQKQLKKESQKNAYITRNTNIDKPNEHQLLSHFGTNYESFEPDTVNNNDDPAGLFTHAHDKQEEKQDYPNNNYNDFISHMSYEETKKLKVSDKIDFRAICGKFYPATIIHRLKDCVEIQYDGYNWEYDEWAHCKIHLWRFAKFGSISQRPAHRFKNVKDGDKFMINPFHRPDYGWCVGKVFMDDEVSGQYQFAYNKQDGNVGCFWFWTHVDNVDEIRKYVRKTQNQNHSNIDAEMGNT